jgi:hypothetical protein
MTHVNQFTQELLPSSSEASRTQVLRHLATVGKETPAAKEPFESRMRGVGALDESDIVAPAFASAPVHEVQDLLSRAIGKDILASTRRALTIHGEVA